jgi:hypothetical protein
MTMKTATDMITRAHPWDLNALFMNDDIDPRHVIVMRHRPHEPELRKVLPWLAAEKPDVFNAYQQTQSEKVERAMLEAKSVASFIGHEPGKALFFGLYSIGKTRPLTYDEYWKVPAYVQMKLFGMVGFTARNRSSILWFDLAPTDFCITWKGKLVVGWPPPERSWWRRAHRNVFPVHAVLEDSALAAAMPAWEQINLGWDELRVLPSRWREALSHWRGIYYIYDQACAKGYVGSAYGEANLLGRWVSYTEHSSGSATVWY